MLQVNITYYLNVTLFLANLLNSFFAGNAKDISEGCIYNTISTMIESFCKPDVTRNGTTFTERQIKLPNEEEARQSGLEFLSRCNFPASFPPIIIGALGSLRLSMKSVY